MCFNKETSLLVYIIGTFCYIYLFYRGFKENRKNDISGAVLLLLIAQMQLVEYFLWKNQKCNYINLLLSIVIVILLYLQSTMNYLTNIYFYGDKWRPNFKTRNYYILLLFTFLLFLMIYKMITWKSMEDVCSLKSNNSCRLNWSFLTLSLKNFQFLILVFFFGLCYFYFFKIPYQNIKYNIISRSFMTCMFLISLLYTLYIGGIDGIGIVGSIFCFLCAFWGIFLILKI